MNAFRMLGDFSNFIGMLLLIWNIWSKKSVTGLSGKTYLLFALTYSFRYVDVFLTFISPYNTLMKAFYLLLSYLMVWLIFRLFKPIYDHISDSMSLPFLIVPCAGLAYLVNHNNEILEIFWTFSTYLEAVAILPQLFMMSKTGEAELITPQYLLCLGLYRLFYLFSWVYRFYIERFFDLIVVVAGTCQSVLYVDFFYLYATLEKPILEGDDSGPSSEAEEEEE